MSYRSHLAWTVLTLAAALTAAWLATRDNRTILLCLFLIGAPMVRPRHAALLLFAVLSVLGLVRRLASDGRVDNDPLLLVPVLLLALAIMKGLLEKREKSSPDWAFFSLGGLVALPLLSWAASDRDLAGLYTAGLFSVCALAVMAARSGVIPDVRPTLTRWAPFAAIALGGYGLVQFFYLPTWDRRWILVSGLSSVGLPAPGQVRVFGSVESPGPYALILGGLLLLLVHAFVSRRGSRGWIGLAIAVCVPALFLSGVRTALLGLAIVGIVAALKLRRIQLLALLAGATLGMLWVARKVLSSAIVRDSNVFTTDRYTAEGLAQDRSVDLRIQLLDSVIPGLRKPLGEGFARARIDNFYIDALLSFGAIGFTLTLVVAATVLAVSLRGDWSVPTAGWQLVALYALVFTLASSVFSTSSGLLVALVWGWLLVLPKQSPRATPTTHSAPPTAPRCTWPSGWSQSTVDVKKDPLPGVWA